MNITPLKINKMQVRPDKGRFVYISMKDGKVIQASTCLVLTGDKSGIIFYPSKGKNRMAIDENLCRGLWYL